MGNGSSVNTIGVNQSFQFDDNINWTRGRHSIKTGFELLELGT